MSTVVRKALNVHAKLIIGKVIGTKMCKTAKVRVTRMVLDKYLTKFFNRRKTYFAHDPEERCMVGDVVLLKALSERRGKHVCHEVAEIVFKLGAIVDPVSGKRCAGGVYLEPPYGPASPTEPTTAPSESVAGAGDQLAADLSRLSVAAEVKNEKQS
ncbi:small ribosomal subunit protein uS17m [Lampetra planeri]